MRLLIFNPETEYALASGASFYTPPALVESFRKANQLLPEAWAEPDDIILVDDVSALESRFRLADLQMLEDIFRKYPQMTVEPWGWNRALVRRLIDNGVPASSLPDETSISRIRSLAHRRTTIILNEDWNNITDSDHMVDVPQELGSEEDCKVFCKNHPGCWIKAPWSSSGRGVINTGADMSDEQVRQWCHGIIRRQGSVLAESAACRIADFATEWKIRGGKAYFLGLSCFNTSNRGKYISNDYRTQAELILYFNSICSVPLDYVVERQKSILERHLSDYSGFMGIDMIIESDGALRPFVEINLRRTMGMLHLNK